MQKGIGRQTEHHMTGVTLNRQRLQHPYRRTGLAFGGAKGAEIMLAHQGLRGKLHRWHIEGLMKPAHQSIVNGWSYRMVMQHIAIGARLRRKSRMKIGWYAPRPLHSNAARQIGITATHPGLRVALCLGIEMHHLRQGMHPGIGAARGGHPHGCVGNHRQGPFQCVLHGIAIGLRLPASKVTAVVTQSQGDATGCHTFNDAPNQAMRKASISATSAYCNKMLKPDCRAWSWHAAAAQRRPRRWLP